ncbi:MAG: S41 family peptidase [Acetobacterales bacterium]
MLLIQRAVAAPYGNARTFRGAIAAGILALAMATASPAQASVFDQSRSELVFTKAFRTIGERYLAPVDFHAMTLAALQALHGKDAGLRLVAQGGTLYLYISESVVGTYALPGSNEAEAWAALASQAAAGAHSHSTLLSEAGAEEIYELILDAALGTLDSFSRYSPPREARDHQAQRRGFGGIGIRFTRVDRGIRIEKVLPGTPAIDGDLREGDLVIAVGRKGLRGLTAEEVTDLLRGPIDSIVDLSVIRGNGEGPFPLALRRAQVIPPTVAIEADDGIVTARVSGFNGNTVPSLRRALVQQQHMHPDGLRGVILDLRGNRGGLLRQAVEMVDLFVPAGEIIATKGRHASSSRTYRASGEAIAVGVPMVVLINGHSASSAEIVAAALQDHHRALIVGTNSYGKGLVQTVVQLPNEGEMALTWSRVVTPSGYPLQGLGVLPTICTSADKAGLKWQFDRLREGSELEITRVLSEWRLVRDAQPAVLERLRAACPGPENAAIELEAAHSLLVEPGLIDRAIRMERGAPGPAATEVIGLPGEPEGERAAYH